MTPTTTSADTDHTLFSNVPREDDVMNVPPKTGGPHGNKNNKNDNGKHTTYQVQKPWYAKFVPPPPEDQFIMTGDIAVLYFYAFTSHSINDWVVHSVLGNPHTSMLQAVHSLDPTGEVVNTQMPSWVQSQDVLAVDHVLSVNAQETLLNHWGPLFATEGIACVALCSCWLLAGWLHRAFLFRNSVDCATDRALAKTLETWVSTCVMMVALAMAANALVEHVPVLQRLLCTECAAAKALTRAAATGMDGTVDADSGLLLLGAGVTKTSSSMFALTRADTMFLVDSMSVLIAWRFMANRIMNIFR
jgi:hypothetical protein